MALFAQFSRRRVAIVALLCGAASASPFGSNVELSFGPPANYDAGGRVQALATADLNRDSVPDLIVGTATGITVILNNGNGTFGAPTSYQVGGTSCVLAADLNGDGLADVAYGITSG